MYLFDLFVLGVLVGLWERADIPCTEGVDRVDLRALRPALVVHSFLVGLEPCTVKYWYVHTSCTTIFLFRIILLSYFLCTKHVHEPSFPSLPSLPIGPGGPGGPVPQLQPKIWFNWIMKHSAHNSHSITQRILQEEQWKMRVYIGRAKSAESAAGRRVQDWLYSCRSPSELGVRNRPYFASLQLVEQWNYYCCCCWHRQLSWEGRFGWGFPVERQ